MIELTDIKVKFEYIELEDIFELNDDLLKMTRFMLLSLHMDYN